MFIGIRHMKKSDTTAFFGSAAQLAKFLCVSPVAVSRWPEIIPETQALRLDRLTNGALRYDPEIYDRKRESRRGSRRQKQTA